MKRSTVQTQEAILASLPPDQALELSSAEIPREERVRGLVTALRKYGSVMIGEEVREFLKISRTQLWSLCNKDVEQNPIPYYRLPSTKGEGPLRFDVVKVAEWMDSNRVNPRLPVTMSEEAVLRRDKEQSPEVTAFLEARGWDDRLLKLSEVRDILKVGRSTITSYLNHPTDPISHIRIPVCKDGVGNDGNPSKGDFRIHTRSLAVWLMKQSRNES